MNKNIIKDIVSMFMLVIGGYILMINIPIEYIHNYLGGDKVYLKNRLIINNKDREVKIVYFDKDKNKIELNYKIDFDGTKKPNVVNKDKYNFFDFFEYNNELMFINLLKKNKNIEKEFSEKLDTNGYVAYYDNIYNNLYVFAHNGTNGINGGKVFYDMKEKDKVKFINSLLNFNEKLTIDKRIVLKKQEFINTFTKNVGVFQGKNKIYLITCYPNYSSTRRLILVLKQNNDLDIK